MILFLPSHNPYLLFYCVLSISALTLLVFMALLCAAIRRYSVSLLKFPFLSHIKVLSSLILLVCRLKYPYSCFPPHFCFLVIIAVFIFMFLMLFLFAVITLSLVFFMLSLSPCIDASMLLSLLATPLPPSFLDTYSLFMSSLGCKASYIVISFLLL